MPKQIEDIVVTNKRKSIRDIPIPENRRKNPRDRRTGTDRRTGVDRREESSRRSEEVVPQKVDSVEGEIPRINTYTPKTEARPSRRKKKFGKKTFITTGVVALLALIASMILFSGATLSYVPKSEKLSFSNEAYSAYKTGEGDLVFSVVKLSGEKSAEVSASGTQEVENKSTGTIVVYNNNPDNKPQPLVDTTRFETPEGKVYRIAEDIVIPAKNGTQPGSIEATVYADAPGEQYNIGLSDFKLPGLKGTAKYETIYARSKTSMSGGFVGESPVVDPSDLSATKSNLEIALKAELASQADAQVPGDFILFPSLSTISYEDVPQSPAGSGTAKVTSRGNFYGVMFKRSDLASYLASEKGLTLEGETVTMPDLDSLVFSFNGDAPANLLTINSISFNVSGEALAVWKTNEETLKADLAGREKVDVSYILNNYPSILSADVVVRPFWKSAFPEDIEDISIKRESVQ